MAKVMKKEARTQIVNARMVILMCPELWEYKRMKSLRREIISYFYL